MVEIPVIVVGILLALWVDAYWQDRMERQAEQVALVAIHAEFEENKLRFDRAIDHHAKIRDSLVQIRNSTSLDCNEELEAAISIATYEWHTFNPVAGATSSLISSGQLDLIGDDALRLHLSSWMGLYADLAHDEMRTVEARDRISEYVARELTEADCATFLSDNIYLAFLELRLLEENEVLSDNGQIPESIQAILSAIESAIL